MTVPIVTFDTSSIFEDGIYQNRFFRNILNYSKDNKVKIIVSYVVLEEWRTQRVTSFRNKQLSIETELERLWKKNPIAELEDFPIVSDVFDPLGIIDINNASKIMVSNMVEEFNIEVLPFTADHAHNVFASYIECEVFNNPPFEIEKKRAKNREHFPDAWILEALIEFKKGFDDNVKFLAVSNDKNLSENLEKNHFVVVENFCDLNNKLEEIFNEADETKLNSLGEGDGETISAPKAQGGNALTNEEYELNDRKTLIESNEEAEIQKKIVGLISYFNGLSLGDLVNYMSKDIEGFAVVSEVDVKGFTYLLARRNLIHDVGEHYLPLENEFTKEARKYVKPFVLALLEEQGGA